MESKQITDTERLDYMINNPKIDILAPFYGKEEFGYLIINRDHKVKGRGKTQRDAIDDAIGRKYEV
jgi:hypothetical protein